jgi:two-component system, chemotaxis family, protein-glutamate methylesterase/glutaminase
VTVDVLLDVQTLMNKDIVVIGASTGGIDALREILRGLSPDLNASVFVVQHSGADAPGILHLILQRRSQIRVVTPADGERIVKGRVYLAPPDRHLILEQDRICLSRGPKENRFRPAIDPLFRSAAQVYGPRVIGVVLTGGLDDGTAGLWAVKRMGGTAIVQDPADAVVPSMPLSASRYVNVDHIVPLVEIAPLLMKLTSTPAVLEGVYEVPKHLDIEVKIAKQDPAIDQDVRKIWEKSSYTCPECHGVLLQFEESGRDRFRCHTGHAFSSDSLLAYLTENVEDSLWTTIRTIEESVLLMNHMAKHIEAQDANAAAEFRQKAAEARERSELVRKAVIGHEQLNEERVMEAAET